jgi:hypothetical protein
MEETNNNARKKLTVEDIKEAAKLLMEVPPLNFDFSPQEVHTTESKARNAFTMLGIEHTEDDVKLTANQCLYFSRKFNWNVDLILLELCRVLAPGSCPPRTFHFETDLKYGGIVHKPSIFLDPPPVV